MNDWFNTGKEATDRANAAKAAPKAYLYRYYMKIGSEAEVSFLDGDNTDLEPIGSYREHSYSTKDGKWPNFCTCVGKSCPVCREGIRAYDAWPFTIIQHKPTWTDRNKVEHKDEIKLMVVKKEAMQKMLRNIGLRKGLVGTVWNVFRSGQKAYTIGDDWQFNRKVGGDGNITPVERRLLVAKEFGMDPKIVVPINYREVLKPKTHEELMAEGIDFEGTRKKDSSFSKKDEPRASAGATGATDDVPY
jgi:hypothetical protein